ncbi:hypothetical protein [Sedimentibacter sp.]|uniref:hypothetical protein n=1 Tax=Sedimentibacter sp. TaxID=1960295 RepID=UPI0028A7DBA2|nr:hypothetical protein [Sedimentibacter sp.]
MNKEFTAEKFWENLLILLIIAFISILGNLTGYDTGIMESIPGMLILLIVALIGVSLANIIPVNIPSVVYISLLGLLISMPASPISNVVIEYTSKIQMLPLATPVLAYSGISMGKNWAEFKKVGWKGILVACCVMFGTFIGSAIIAQIILKSQGII